MTESSAEVTIDCFLGRAERLRKPLTLDQARTLTLVFGAVLSDPSEPVPTASDMNRWISEVRPTPPHRQTPGTKNL